MMSQLSHRNVVRFHGVAFSPEDETLIVTEFCLNGSLRACMDKGLLDRIPFSAPREEDQSLLKFSIQILSGLRYLHDDAATTVVHRDLKSANVLVTKDWVMKIADFGSAKKKTMHLQTFAGTPAYMAPEMLRQDEDKMGQRPPRLLVPTGSINSP
jgi:serine/threonine protein kinase